MDINTITSITIKMSLKYVIYLYQNLLQKTLHTFMSFSIY